jgi:hypothetical protein
MVATSYKELAVSLRTQNGHKGLFNDWHGKVYISLLHLFESKQYPQGESNPLEHDPAKTAHAIDSKDFTSEIEQGKKNQFDYRFDQILKKHPELARLIQAWPRLSKHYQEAILETVLKHTDSKV